MSDCPLSASEIRSLITRLTDLEAWVASRESSAPSGVQQGYRQGGVADRGRVVPQSQKQVTVFPGIPQLAFGWKLEKEAVPDFKEAFGDLPARCLEGPGPVPNWLEDQADFISWDPKEATQRLHLAYSSGFFARIALDTFTEFSGGVKVSEPAEHFVVLRATGLGGRICQVCLGGRFPDLPRQNWLNWTCGPGIRNGD